MAPTMPGLPAKKPIIEKMELAHRHPCRSVSFARRVDACAEALCGLQMCAVRGTVQTKMAMPPPVIEGSRGGCADGDAGRGARGRGAQDKAGDDEALGLVGLLGQVGVVGAHGSGGSVEWQEPTGDRVRR